jgi:ligand-binding sensor domain-containing protein
MIDDKEMWLGTYGRGIIVLDYTTKKIRKIFSVVGKGNVSGLLVKSIIKDSFNNIWVGTSGGMFLFDRKSEEFNLINETGNVFVWDIIEDKNNDIWFVSSGSGAFRYNIKSEKLQNYQHKENDNNSISDNFILTVCKDNNQQLWFGTEENGFCKYNYETDNFKQFNDLPKFSNRLIYAIVADNYNNIWFSTSNGLFRFDPEN